MEAAPHFAVVDVETTGGKPEYARIIEIGIVLVDDWKITQKFDSLVKVPVELSPFIQNLTGITPKMLYNAPEFDEIAPKVDAMLEGRIFVAHNVASDYGAVGAEIKRSGFDFSPERLCTVKLSRRVFPGLPKYSLHELSMSLGLPDFGQHRALNDAIAAALNTSSGGRNTRTIGAPGIPTSSPVYSCSPVRAIGTFRQIRKPSPVSS